MATPQNSHHRLDSVSKTYHDSIELYIKRFLTLVGVALVPNLITYILILSLRASVISSIARLNEIQDYFSLSNVNLYIAFLIFAIIIVVYILGVIALTWTVINHEKATILGAFEHSLAYFWRFVAQSIALALITTAGLLAGYLIVALIGVVLGNFSVELINDWLGWLTLLPLLVSSIFSAFFLFAVYSIIDKDNSTTKALQHSFRMVRTHFWAVIVRVVLIYIFIYVLVFVLNLIPYVGNAFALLIVLPFAVVYLYVLYKNLDSAT
ncbi:MAG: hypothetical protein ABIG66_00075 [Candidatus Kerfeldbacteria bacterium]